jgi:Peptidase family M1 domain
MSLARPSSGLLIVLLVLGFGSPTARAADPGPPPEHLPAWLPRYDLDVRLDVQGHTVRVRECVTWINRHRQPSRELVFNAYTHYQIPDGDVALFAKTLELLRQAPSEGLSFGAAPLEVQRVVLQHARLDGATEAAPGRELPFHFREDNQTALVVELPGFVRQGEEVTVLLEFTVTLPPRQGRWGQWQGVTFLATWLPVLAFYDDAGWQPTPFLPWHQPFFNEAGVYHARVTLPCDQRVACTGSILSEADLGDGWKQVEIHAWGARDFAFLCSSRFAEFTGEAVGTPESPPVHVRCLAFPEHAYYAREMVRYVCEAIPVYQRWFGPYPYPEFTVVESYFAWNGNECGGLVMIDERQFGLPHLARGYIEYLVSHELCHQWWYNLIGTNGYCETFMDESMATYFAHRLLNLKHGKNSPLLHYPMGLEWLPNLNRETYRIQGMYGTVARGEHTAVVTEMPNFGHLFNLLSMTYDKGSRIVGMIEDRLGEAAFIDFMHVIYREYRYRILRVADFRRELEAFTGQCWEEFFRNWLYGSGFTDWCVEDVHIKRLGPLLPALRGCGPACAERAHYKVTVLLHQKGDYTEPTVLGFCLDCSDNYQVRVPVQPNARILDLDDPPCHMESLPDNRVRVEVILPSRPTQIAVDPDQVLVDRDPANNYWKPHIKWRLTPFYTMLDETDMTTAYDRWNVIAGPWLFMTAYNDPWYTRSTMLGARVGVYRTQQFNGGVYLGYRTDYRDFVAGVDGLWDHVPFARTQVGFSAERRLAEAVNGEQEANRVGVFGRYIFQYGSSLYLPPMHYVEAFGTVQDNFLPVSRRWTDGAMRFDQLTMTGLHYHVNYLTPYWDAEGGYQFDATYATGIAVLGQHEAFNKVEAQFSTVKGLPDWTGPLADTRLAARVYGAGGAPDRGQYYSLGGELLFRGFDLGERQGSLVWLSSLEWRVPVVRGLTYDALDHAVGLRAVYAAAFYDVGNAYLRGQPLGPIAHAVGLGLRMDVAWFSFIERTIIRLDVAKAVNSSAPVQIWFGLQHPF